MPVTIARYFVSFISALVVVFSLFWVMQYLIATGQSGLDDDEAGTLLEFVRVPKNEAVELKKPKPEKPPQPDEPPPEPPPPTMDNVAPDSTTIAVTAPNVQANINLDSSGFSLAASDGEYLPIVKVTPIYPRRAQSRGIEGYVIVEFTVTPLGTTKDHRVVEADPPGIFDRSAIQAAEKFKYKPRVVDGVAIEVPGVQNIIRFELED